MTIAKLRVVDDHVWRGAAPDADGYRDLAAAGVTTVVDLRAERDVVVDGALLDDLGLHRFQIPIRDGQVPTAAQVAQFLAIVAAADATVYVHCGAGVGRTGAMVAAYLLATGQAGATEALRRNLAVGPPSLEQAASVFGRPHPAVVALSRVLDAPRRTWARARGMLRRWCHR